MRLSRLLGTLILLVGLCGTVSSSQARDTDQFQALKQFSQVLDLIEKNYVQEVNRTDLIHGAIQGMLNSIDPHSTYIDLEKFKMMQEEFQGEFGGIGIQIGVRDKRLTVIAPIEDTPADKAGLKPGDIIVEIDGESALDTSLEDAVAKIRGPKGKPVTLTILHKDSQTPEKVTIIRGLIPLISVKTKELEPGYLHVRLTDFKANTTEDLHRKLQEYATSTELKGIVLDLRNNPGGLLNQAISVTDTFLRDGLIVYTQGRDPKSRKDETASRQATDVNCPVVVLINAGSASASEIVAGALQDRKRAILIGERTFGKGSVQTIMPLSDGSAVKLTIALYYTPNGRSIQAEGIEPDVDIPFVPPTEEGDKANFREANLSKHLDNPNGDFSAAIKTEDAKEILAKDNQLRMGLSLVKSLPRFMQISN
ncbi:MAG: S41 family peptidase [Desulfovibrionales bacterium]|nr:S41 family peptidase [Desulfovibrionales bacterium]